MEHGRRIIEEFRLNATRKSLELGNDVTFQEFLKYVLAPKLSKTDKYTQSYDRHWAPFNDLCHPCLIKYNVIAKYETLKADTDFVLQKIGTKNISLPKSSQAGGTRKKIEDYFKNFSKKFIRKVYNIYQNDFEFFDYKISDVLPNF